MSVYRRSVLLSCRDAFVRGGPAAPKQMQTLKTMGLDEAPHIFSNRDRKRGERREGRTSRSNRDAAGAKEPRVGSRSSEAKAAEKEFIRRHIQAEKDRQQERVQLESLVNYMAFNPPTSKRSFLSTDHDGGAPAATTTAAAVAPKRKDEANTDPTTAAKVLDEAMLVLAGAKRYKRVDMAKSLFDQLADAKCPISEETYTAAVETCVECGDLKEASVFLAKMEAAGHLADGALLDKVMGLYSQDKQQNALDSEYQGVMQRAAARANNFGRGQAVVSGIGGALSPDAPAFIPGGKGSPVKLNPGATAFVPGGGGGTPVKFSVHAAEFVPSPPSAVGKVFNPKATEFTPNGSWSGAYGVGSPAIINDNYSSSDDDDDEEDGENVAGKLEKRRPRSTDD